MGERRDDKMVENRAFLIVLLVLAGISFLFLLIGFFGPGWLVYELTYNPNFQLFTGHGNAYGGSYGGYGNTYGGNTYGGGYNNQYGTGYQGGGTYGGTYGTGGYGGGNYGGSNYNPAYGSGMQGYGVTIVNMKTGLWAFHGCIEMLPNREDCKVTISKLKTSIGEDGYSSYNTKTGTDMLFDDMKAQKALTTIALILAFIGLVFNVLFFTPIIESKKFKRIVCALCWILAAILMFAAIGVQGQAIAELNETFKDFEKVYTNKYKWKTYFPWSLFLLGVSAFLGLIDAVLTLFMLPRCVQHEYDGASYHGTPMNDKI